MRCSENFICKRQELLVIWICWSRLHAGDSYHRKIRNSLQLVECHASHKCPTKIAPLSIKNCFWKMSNRLNQQQNYVSDLIPWSGPRRYRFIHGQLSDCDRTTWVLIGAWRWRQICFYRILIILLAYRSETATSASRRRNVQNIRRIARIARIYVGKRSSLGN